MNLQKFTLKMQEALGEGQSLAAELGHSELAPAHVFKATLAQVDGVVRDVTATIGDQVTAGASLLNIEVSVE